MMKVLLLGGGGHAKCVIDALKAGKKFTPAAVFDLPARAGGEVLGVKISGSDADLPAWRKRGFKLAFVALGSTGDPARRAILWKKAAAADFDFPNIVHPSAIVSKFADLGRGIYVGPGAIVNAGAVIGDGCIINSGAIVEHDCRLGEFVHAGPGAVLCAGVEIGSRSHIGAKAAVVQYLEIGSDTIVGAGSAVVSDLPSHAVCVGVPAKKIKSR